MRNDLSIIRLLLRRMVKNLLIAIGVLIALDTVIYLAQPTFFTEYGWRYDGIWYEINKWFLLRIPFLIVNFAFMNTNVNNGSNLNPYFNQRLNVSERKIVLYRALVYSFGHLLIFMVQVAMILVPLMIAKSVHSSPYAPPYTYDLYLNAIDALKNHSKWLRDIMLIIGAGMCNAAMVTLSEHGISKYIPGVLGFVLIEMLLNNAHYGVTNFSALLASVFAVSAVMFAWKIASNGRGVEYE